VAGHVGWRFVAAVYRACSHGQFWPIADKRPSDTKLVERMLPWQGALAAHFRKLFMAGSAAPPLDDAAILALLDAQGPLCQSNWKLFAARAPRTAMVEAVLYTDTRIFGELELGPLKFINTIAHSHHGQELRPAIVLRFSCHWPAQGYKPVTGTSDNHYHAGDHFDEAAALASLILGIRLQAGPITRDFRVRGDPLGTPINLSDMKAMPTLYPSRRNPMVPRLNEPANLVDLEIMAKLPRLTREAASVLVKAARTYQTALWFADSHPEMAWLFLVSAIETAAGSWAKKHFVEDESFLPDAVSEILRKHNCPESVDGPISEYLKESTKSTRKFIAFLLRFLPDPPKDRPESGSLHVNFDVGELKKDFLFIYRCRSRALHTGVPFPMAVCLPPNPQLKEERIFSIGMSSNGATWDFKKYQPLLFHFFEHITRGALLRWYDSLDAD
jgi:hypothetical protein